MHADLWIALLSGIAVAASCGLRAFLPLLLLGIASRAGLVHLRGGMDWLAGDIALTALAIATVIEVVGDKVPVVDHALDAVGTVLRPVAAWLGAYGMLVTWPTPWAQLTAIVLGTLALAVHGLRSSVRVGSTVTTLGTANPVLSLVDDAIVLLLMAAAIFGAIAVLLAIPVFFWLRGRRRATVAPGTSAPLSPAS